MTERNSTHKIKQGIWEAATCLLLGFRHALTVRAVLLSLSLWVAAIGVWIILFLVFREQLLQLALKAVAIVVYGIGVLLPDSAAGTPSGTGSFGAAVANISSLALSWVLVALGYIVAVVLTVRVLAELLLMGWIRQQALKSFPDLSSRGFENDANAKRIAFGIWIRPWGALIGLAPLCLLLPVVGGVLLFVLLSYLNVRFLVNDATDDLASPQEVRALLGGSRIELLALGLMATLLNLVPLLGLLSPWVTGSAVCHLAMRKLSASRFAQASG